MIRWNSMVRIKKSGRLGFICDFDSDVHGDPRDPRVSASLHSSGPGTNAQNGIESSASWRISSKCAKPKGLRDASCAQISNTY